MSPRSDMFWPMVAASLGGHVALLISTGFIVDEREYTPAWQAVSFEILDTSLVAQESATLREDELLEVVLEPPPALPNDPQRSAEVRVQPSRRSSPPHVNNDTRPTEPRGGEAAVGVTALATQVGTGVVGGALTTSSAEPEQVTPGPETSGPDGESPNGPSVYEDDFGTFTFGPSRRAPTPAEAAQHVGHLDHLDGDRPGGDPHGSNEALAGRISSDLARATVQRHLSRRPNPVLRPTPDGGYRWESDSIIAEIQPNGEVEFGNKDLGDPRFAQGMIGIAGNLDVTGPYMRALGQNPYRYEEQWFMNRTEEVRDRLRDEWARRVMQDAIAELPARLERIWRRARTPAHKRRRLFETWAECDEGARGDDARRGIIRFIRRRMPQGSPAGYSDTDLAALNQGRRGRRFAPYGVSPR